MTKAADARLTPEQLEKRVEDRKKKADLDSARKRHLNAAFSTPDGIHALRFILERCGYDKKNLVVDQATGEVQKDAMVYNEARRNLYVELRTYLKPEILMQVEFPEIHRQED